MVGKILTAVGYVKAPKATTMLKHPVKGASALIAYKAARKAAPARARRAVGAAVALLAVPFAVKALVSSDGKA